MRKREPEHDNEFEIEGEMKRRISAQEALMRLEALQLLLQEQEAESEILRQELARLAAENDSDSE